MDVRARAGDAPDRRYRGSRRVVNRLGVARTFQNIRLFPALTALENVKVGIETRQKSGPISAMLGLPRQRREERESTQGAYQLLYRVGLEARANDIAGSLAYGEQRRLEIARALGTSPGVILLDEPAAGTNPAEKRELATLIKSINTDDGVSVLLIEHDMKLVMSIADRIVVLNFGQKIAEGTPGADPAQPRGDRGLPGHPGRRGGRPDLSQPELHRIDLGQSLDELTGQQPLRASPGGTADESQGSSMTDTLLTCDDIEVRYGAIKALKGVSFEVRSGEVIALLGANGAGKTTTQKTVSGMLRPALGEILYEGQRIDGIPAHDLIRLGICHVPEGRRVFPRMTVHENLEMGAFRFKRPDPARVGARAGTVPPVARADPAAGRHAVRRRAADAGDRPGPDGQADRLLLLDEPSMGLAPLIVKQIFDIVKEINASGVTVLIVEQNAAQALALAHRGYVLETGEIVLTGTGAELLADDRVRAAYLGEEIAS